MNTLPESVKPAAKLKLARFIALGFGSGLAPKMPGTFGTLAAVPLYWLLQPLPLAAYLGLTLALFILGVWACQVTSAAMGVHDHPSIVWDEVVGFLITMSFAPSGAFWLVAGFVLFRLFDIWKPWPIRWLDRRVDGGLGIMIDDVLAGVYAAVVLVVMAYLL